MKFSPVTVLLMLFLLKASDGLTQELKCQTELSELSIKFHLFDKELKKYNADFFEDTLAISDLYADLIFTANRTSNENEIFLDAYLSRTLEVISIGALLFDFRDETISKPRVKFPNDTGIGIFETDNLNRIQLNEKEINWLTECLKNN